MLKRPLAILLLIILAVVSGWMLWRTTPEPRTAQHTGAGPDYTMENFTATTLTEKGTPQYRLTATLMSHYAEADIMDLEKPVLTFYAEKGEPWTLRAEQGKVTEKGAHILMLGEVFIDREGGKENTPLHMITHDLLLLPKEEYAESESPTVIRTDSIELEAIGLQAYLNEQRLMLMQQVRGKYNAPPP